MWNKTMGYGRGLGTNAHVTTLGGLGFRRGPLGGGFSPGVRRGYEHMVEPRWPRLLAVWASRWAELKKNIYNDVAWPRHPSHAHHTL
ncbi:hypothetical protein HanHA300_Chr08g0269001 [Helianthus annuus]|nr:hypothetical protein HanHA300_Chr08g0269001 [Helianthus annuus]